MDVTMATRAVESRTRGGTSEVVIRKSMSSQRTRDNVVMRVLKVMPVMLRRRLTGTRACVLEFSGVLRSPQPRR